MSIIRRSAKQKREKNKNVQFSSSWELIDLNKWNLESNPSRMTIKGGQIANALCTGKKTTTTKHTKLTSNCYEENKKRKTTKLMNQLNLISGYRANSALRVVIRRHRGKRLSDLPLVISWYNNHNKPSYTTHP